MYEFVKLFCLFIEVAENYFFIFIIIIICYYYYYYYFRPDNNSELTESVLSFSNDFMI